jgi:hypothetical protein
MRFTWSVSKGNMVSLNNKIRAYKYGKNPGTLNRARMLEHCIQHRTELPNHMLEHWFQLTDQAYLF